MKVEILNTKEKVIKLLTRKPHLRDDDQKLIANIWNIELSENGITPNTITGFTLLTIFSEGNVMSNPESIRRCRQKAQEELPNLRGNNWAARHKNEEKIEKELGYKTKNK